MDSVQKLMKSRRWLIFRNQRKLIFYAIVVAIFPFSGKCHAQKPNSFDQIHHKGVFLQLPFSNPPTVRPPPYSDSYEQCPEINHRENWVGTLCGNLNEGIIPGNPFGHKFTDLASESYPFEIIKNKTLQFFRHSLPILRNDKSLPKVARYNPYDFEGMGRHKLTKRSVLPDDEDSELVMRLLDEDSFRSRGHRGQWQNHLTETANKFCMSPQPKGSLICKLYNAMWRKPTANSHSQTQNQLQTHHHHVQAHDVNRKTYYPTPAPEKQSHYNSYETHHYAESKQQALGAESTSPAPAPATPCPSSAEYLTPVFARNHEGAWRYVVQIPREGYFTQTVEVTKCGETKCFFMEGTCSTSPRWQSLLVAEMFYPEAAFPVTQSPNKNPSPPYNSFNQYHQNKIKKRNGKVGNSDIPPQCDGVDEIGCFQVRLFYDWFLIPGSCKCWKRPFDFTRGH